jgi:hypothetical protein
VFVGTACACYKKHVVAKVICAKVGGIQQTCMSLQAEKQLVITTHISIFLLTRELPTWSRVLLEKILPILKYMVALVASPWI